MFDNRSANESAQLFLQRGATLREGNHFRRVICIQTARIIHSRRRRRERGIGIFQPRCTEKNDWRQYDRNDNHGRGNGRKTENAFHHIKQALIIEQVLDSRFFPREIAPCGTDDIDRLEAVLREFGQEIREALNMDI